MVNFGDYIRRHQEGEGYQTSTGFEELKISEDESFDSFYGKLNEVVIEKLNLVEKTEDSKVVRKDP